MNLMLALAGIAEDPTGGIATLLITASGIALLPLVLMFGGGWKLVLGAVVLAADAYIASCSGGFALRWQRRHHVPEALIGFVAIACVLVSCTLVHGALLAAWLYC